MGFFFFLEPQPRGDPRESPDTHGKVARTNGKKAHRKKPTQVRRGDIPGVRIPGNQVRTDAPYNSGKESFLI